MRLVELKDIDSIITADGVAENQSIVIVVKDSKWQKNVEGGDDASGNILRIVDMVGEEGNVLKETMIISSFLGDPFPVRSMDVPLDILIFRRQVSDKSPESSLAVQHGGLSYL